MVTLWENNSSVPSVQLVYKPSTDSSFKLLLYVCVYPYSCKKMYGSYQWSPAGNGGQTLLKNLPREQENLLILTTLSWPCAYPTYLSIHLCIYLSIFLSVSKVSTLAIFLLLLLFSRGAQISVAWGEEADERETTKCEAIFLFPHSRSRAPSLSLSTHTNTHTHTVQPIRMG